MLPNIDFLQKECKRIYFFGLGFIQVVVNDFERFHFYSKHLPAFVGEPHNHRYNFTSFILKGELQQVLYNVSICTADGHSHMMRKENCQKGNNISSEIKVKCIETFSMSLKEGSSYSMLHTQFHTVNPIGECITKLIRGPYKKDLADVLRVKGKEKACPFSVEIPEGQLWEIIRSML